MKEPFIIGPRDSIRIIVQRSDNMQFKDAVQFECDLTNDMLERVSCEDAIRWAIESAREGALNIAMSRINEHSLKDHLERISIQISVWSASHSDYIVSDVRVDLELLERAQHRSFLSDIVQEAYECSLNFDRNSRMISAAPEMLYLLRQIVRERRSLWPTSLSDYRGPFIEAAEKLVERIDERRLD